MKKTFKLTDPKHAPERKTDSVKSEIRKYIARERRKVLPKDADFWDFDCRFGDDPTTAAVIHIGEINKKIDAVVALKKETFYIEILAKPGMRTQKS